MTPLLIKHLPRSTGARVNAKGVFAHQGHQAIVISIVLATKYVFFCFVFCFDLRNIVFCTRLVFYTIMSHVKD